jgi:hypothetical protein
MTGRYFLRVLAMLALLGVAPAAVAQQTSATAGTRITRPDGVTISYPGPASGLPHGVTPTGQPPDAPPPAANELGTLAGVAPPSAALPGIALLQASPLQPNGALLPSNPGPVQAFAASVPNSGAATAPWVVYPPHAVALPNWSSPVRQTAPCHWTVRRRIGC